MDAADLAERNMELDRARSLGVAARRRDKPVDACPYTDQDERDAWVGGWMAEDNVRGGEPVSVQCVSVVLDADQLRYLQKLLDAELDRAESLAATFRSVLQAQEEAVTKKPQRLTWDAVEGASSYDVVIDEETEHGWTVKSFSPSVYLGTRPFKTVRIRALSSSGWIVAETFRRTQFIRGAELAVLQRPS